MPDNTFFTTEETYNPTKEDPIQLDLNQPAAGGSTAATSPNAPTVPLPNVIPSNLPMGGGAQQSNTELATALNLFNKGGIVSAKKSF